MGQHGKDKCPILNTPQLGKPLSALEAPFITYFMVNFI